MDDLPPLDPIGVALMDGEELHGTDYEQYDIMVRFAFFWHRGRLKCAIGAASRWRWRHLYS